MYIHASSQNATMSLQFLIIKESRQQILNHCGGWKVNEVLHYKSCQFRPSTRHYWISTRQNPTASVLNKSSTYSFSVYLLHKPWMCAHFSCKTAYVSSQWVQKKPWILKCHCFLFDGTDVWESSMVDNFCCAVKSWVNDWLIRGTQRQFSENYMFGRRFEI